MAAGIFISFPNIEDADAGKTTRDAQSRLMDNPIALFGNTPNVTAFNVSETGEIFASGLPSGATQVASGAVANELWVTLSHATLPDHVVMRGV